MLLASNQHSWQILLISPAATQLPWSYIMLYSPRINRGLGDITQRKKQTMVIDIVDVVSIIIINTKLCPTKLSKSPGIAHHPNHDWSPLRDPRSVPKFISCS
ncbi:unnamed protein product [Eruca vesicaria subsp. sativa]|uniref:Uncharacterized protein n=1 Tax=Eruca vesicaria subsp. sativa TaxID=29727 RepID=A0ABC8JED4_ERUVS|nr:unnamed protein product [Eruca vesicaria subsp. sativa]